MDREPIENWLKKTKSQYWDIYITVEKVIEEYYDAHRYPFFINTFHMDHGTNHSREIIKYLSVLILDGNNEKPREFNPTFKSKKYDKLEPQHICLLLCSAYLHDLNRSFGWIEAYNLPDDKKKEFVEQLKKCCEDPAHYPPCDISYATKIFGCKNLYKKITKNYKKHEKHKWLYIEFFKDLRFKGYENKILEDNQDL